MSLEKPSIVVVGSTGNGKSTLCNYLSNTNLFSTSSSALPETKDTKLFNCCLLEKHDNWIIVDTPGLNDTDTADSISVRNMVEKIKSLKNVKGFVFVFNFQASRFDSNVKRVLRVFKEVLGKNFASNSCLFFTRTYTAMNNSNREHRNEREKEYCQYASEFCNVDVNHCYFGNLIEPNNNEEKTFTRNECEHMFLWISQNSGFDCSDIVAVKVGNRKLDICNQYLKEIRLVKDGKIEGESNFMKGIKKLKVFEISDYFSKIKEAWKNARVKLMNSLKTKVINSGWTGQIMHKDWGKEGHQKTYWINRIKNDASKYCNEELNILFADMRKEALFALKIINDKGLQYMKECFSLMVKDLIGKTEINNLDFTNILPTENELKNISIPEGIKMSDIKYQERSQGGSTKGGHSTVAYSYTWSGSTISDLMSVKIDNFQSSLNKIVNWNYIFEHKIIDNLTDKIRKITEEKIENYSNEK